MTYKEEIAYFEDLATKNKLVGHTPAEPHFVRLNVLELKSVLKGKENFPLVAFEKPSYPIDGHTNSMKKRTLGSILILNIESDKHKVDSITDIEQQAITIAEQFVLKMIEDRKAGMFVTLDLKGFGIDVIPAPIDGKLYGCRLRYSFNNELGEFDDNDWN